MKNSERPAWMAPSRRQTAQRQETAQPNQSAAPASGTTVGTSVAGATAPAGAGATPAAAAAPAAVGAEPQPKPRRPPERGYNPYDTATTRASDIWSFKPKRT